MSNNNLLQGYTWDAQYDDPQQQFQRPIQDEVISVYEVYVKEETVAADTRNDIPIISNEPGPSGLVMQGDCLDLDAAMGSEVVNVDGTISKLLGNDAAKYKILEQNVNENNVVMYSHSVNEPPSTGPRLVDKDDPRSRLHFVKYLKRDGKTLKIWECGICSKEFRHQYTLMRHLPTHTDERNFKCEACGKAFRQLSTLSQHRAIHSDARPYVCEFCKKTFNRVSTLISHRKTHSEHKPHKCHLCGKGFHQKGNLRNHVFTHTNERPYKCETCGKGFNQMSNLMCHKIKAHAHAEKMQYVCGICGKEFPRRFSLRSHEEYKHGIKYRQPNAPVVLQDVNEPAVVRNKSVNIAPLLNGERSLADDAVDDKENINPGGLYPGSVIVDKIDTKAMENAILEGQTPFALFKPAKGIPVLVKVGTAANQKQLLTPATAEDLRMAGKMTLSPSAADLDGVKAVQIKVPVVATVTQRVEPDGNYSFLIEPPGPGQEQESLIEPIESEFTCLDQRDLRCDTGGNQGDKNSQEDCNDLLELAAQGGIQFVRATEDGRYEVMTNSEARDLMAQNSHDVTILDGEDAEAISVVNVRGQDNQYNNCNTVNNNRQEIVNIGDSNEQITLLNAGNNPLKNEPMDDGIEILDEKDIRILGAKCLESDRLLNGITPAIFEQDKIYDYHNICAREFCNLDSQTAAGPPTPQDNVTQISNNNQTNSINKTTSAFNNIQGNSSSIQKNNHRLDTVGPSMVNYSFNDVKQNHSNDNMPSGKNCQSIDILGNGRDFQTAGFPCDVIKTEVKEVKILGPKNQNKIKIFGQDKILQLDKSGLGDTVRILGNVRNQELQEQGDEFKDFKILGGCGYEQFITGTQSADERGADLVKKEVKILGKKKESYRNKDFEVRSSIEMVPTRCLPETILIDDSPKIPNYKSADFIQLASCRRSGDEIEIDLIENSAASMRDVEMQVNSLNDRLREISGSDDVEKDDKISEVATISERDFEMIGHCRAIMYDSLPDLD